MPAEWERFLDECIREIAGEPLVLDIGSGQPFQKELAKYRDLFRNCRYCTLDFDARYGADVVGDAHHLPFGDGFADAVICKAVLEYAPEPHRVVGEIYRVLRPGGKTFVYVPFLYPYHGNERFKDYYRFTRDGVGYMFRDFSSVRVAAVRGYLGTLNLFVPGTSKDCRMTGFLDRLVGGRTGVTSGYNIFAIK